MVGITTPAQTPEYSSPTMQTHPAMNQRFASPTATTCVNQSVSNCMIICARQTIVAGLMRQRPSSCSENLNALHAKHVMNQLTTDSAGKQQCPNNLLPYASEPHSENVQNLRARSDTRVECMILAYSYYAFPSRCNSAPPIPASLTQERHVHMSPAKTMCTTSRNST